MKKFFKDFGNFIKRGNVLDLAVGIIIGGAFNKIVSSLVNDILMPIISLPFNGDLNTKFFVLRGSAEYISHPESGVLELVKSTDAVLMFYGRFIQSVIDFLIIGFTLFVIIRTVIKFNEKREQLAQEIKQKIGKGEDLSEEEEEHIEEEEPEVKEEILLLREIRDSLQKE